MLLAQSVVQGQKGWDFLVHWILHRFVCLILFLFIHSNISSQDLSEEDEAREKEEEEKQEEDGGEHTKVAEIMFGECDAFVILDNSNVRISSPSPLSSPQPPDPLVPPAAFCHTDSCSFMFTDV